MSPVDSSLGAVYVGTIVSSVLYGFTGVQSWYYFTHYPSDRWYLKLLVAAVLFTDTVHEALIAHMVYVYVITNFGNFDVVDHIVWSLDVEVLFNALTTLAVQCFLAVRVYKLSNKSWILTAVVMVFVLGEFITSFIFSIMSLPLVTWEEFATLNDLSMTINAFSAVGDLVIAAILCYLLHSSRTGFQRSNSLIKKLIIFTVNTGILTSLCAFGSLISISIWKNAWIYLGFYFCIGRFYCNTLLATLNARDMLRNGVERTEDMSMSYHGTTAQQKTSHSFFATSSRHVPNNISVKIDTTQEYIRDEYSSGDLKTGEVV